MSGDDEPTSEAQPTVVDGSEAAIRAPHVGVPARDIGRGATLDHYVLLSEIGAGAMGQVFLADDGDLHRKVAIKVLHPRLVARGGSMTSATKGRLLREAQSAAQLTHPNVTAIYGVGRVDDVPYIAMEYVDGQDLRSWLNATDGGRPTWRDVLDKFVQAGRGLHAAHQAGLLHRDFKPDNVLISRSGVAKVTDFGLAGREDAVPPSANLTESDQKSSLDMRLTTTGTVMGTPAYMAPEQHKGLRVDARADQYAFCAALYEGLHGARPFRGKTLKELLRAKDAKKLEPHDSNDVPAWLDAIIARGLEPEPDSRWSSVAALLDAIDRASDKARRRRLYAGLAGIAAMGALIPVGFQVRERAAIQACEVEADQITTTWNEQHRSAVLAGLQAVEVGHAKTTADRVLTYFDARALDYERAKFTACKRANVEKIWDEQLLAQSEWCLDERRMELEALADQLAEADGPAVDRAIAAAAALRPAAPCLNADVLRRLPVPPADRTAVSEIRRDLSTAGALRAAGRYEAGLRLARRALEQAQAIDWSPLTAAARLSVGELLDETGEYDEAESTFEAAYFEAAACGALEVATDSASSLVHTVGQRSARHADGRRWAKHADVALIALGAEDNPVRHARLLHERGRVEFSAADYEAALDLYERALSLEEATFGVDHLAVTDLLNDIAAAKHARGAFDDADALNRRALSILSDRLGPRHPHVANALESVALTKQRRGKFDEAEALIDEALGIKEASLGTRHPDVATSLLRRGSVKSAQGDYTAARASYERALAILEETKGKEHPDLAEALNNLAAVASYEDDVDRARELLERSLRIKEAALGPDHPEVATALFNLGRLEYFAGESDAAATKWQRALDIWESTRGETHPDVAEAAYGLGALEYTRKDYAAAQRYYERALAVREETLGESHPSVGQSLVGLAWTRLAREDHDEARELCLRALEIAEHSKDESAMARYVESDAHFVLAKAMLVSDLPGDRQRAIDQAKQAKRGFAELGPAFAPNLENVERWLATHGGRQPP